MFQNPCCPDVVDIGSAYGSSFGKGKNRIEAKEQPGIPLGEEIRRDAPLNLSSEFVEISHDISCCRSSAE